MIQQKRRELRKSLRKSLPENIRVLLLRLLGCIPILSKERLCLLYCLCNPSRCDLRNASVVLLVGSIVCETQFRLFALICSNLSEQRNDGMLAISHDDVTTSEELEEHVVCAITEGDVNDTVRSNLRDPCNATGFQELAQASNEGRGRSGRSAGVLCDMSAETGVDDELATMVWFGKFEEENTLDVIAVSYSVPLDQYIHSSSD